MNEQSVLSFALVNHESSHDQSSGTFSISKSIFKVILENVVECQELFEGFGNIDEIHMSFGIGRDTDGTPYRAVAKVIVSPDEFRIVLDHKDGSGTSSTEAIATSLILREETEAEDFADYLMAGNR